MSTRATYHFKNEAGYEADDGSKDVTIYVHQDGYPSGAAFNFLNMLDAESSIHSGLGTRFIRGNQRAEITESHEAHIDTRYRYTISQDGDLIVSERKHNPEGRGFEDDFWEEFYVGTLKDFIIQHADDDDRAMEIFEEGGLNLKERGGARLGDVLPIQREDEKEFA